MKFTRMVGSFVAGTTLAVAAFGNAAAADPADDVQIVIDNLPAAVELVPPALQAVVDNYNANGSVDLAVATALQQGTPIMQALTQGTEQFGLLPLGYALFVAMPAHGTLSPFLQAIDDPATAADLIDADEIAGIVDRLPAAVEILSENLTVAVVEGLQGNLIAGTSLNALNAPAVLGNVVQGTALASMELLQGTQYEPAAMLVLGVSALAGIASAGYIQDLEDDLAPIFDALAPVTAPLVDVLGS